MKPLSLVILATAISAASLVGCSKDPAEKFVSYTEDLADLLDKHKDDCDKLAEKLKSWVDSNGADMRKANETMMEKYKGASKEDEKAAQEKYGSRIDKAKDKSRDAKKKCGDNPKVQEAMKGMRG